MTKRRKPKLKEKIRVVTDDFDHPFKSNTLVEVTEILDYGVVWAKDKSGILGCLIPDDYVFEDSIEK
ncbi:MULTISPECIES: hypothetical protein [Bacillus]|uniref:hypothetical protein n=1 Tax=Bacillus TaxID=1386 RepID=UPI00114D3ED6|nr:MULTISPECIES: hypothetical protein [Bacillus]MEC1440539.1 hypothetical protein [Bacillus sonorensis]TWK91161.1 hypothetical protein CHCC20327_2538 [Bacillus licheniformis]